LYPIPNLCEKELLWQGEILLGQQIYGRKINFYRSLMAKTFNAFEKKPNCFYSQGFGWVATHNLSM
jgi:hypothetical protein